MKTLLIALLFIATACSKPSGPAGPQSAPGTAKETGGVDVGNMNQALVPKTQAELTYPAGWSAKSDADVVKIQNADGSFVSARRAEITDLASPTAIGIQAYLKAKFPTRDYKLVNINGFSGVRAELQASGDTTQSDLYLVSETHDFVHVESRLSQAARQAGEAIVASVRVEYKGVAVTDSQPRTVRLANYDSDAADRLSAAYSFSGDCYAYLRNGCPDGSGVTVLFRSGAGHDEYLSVGNAGADDGRIIDMGSDIGFDSIRVEGKYLVAPKTKTPLADIYTEFQPKNPAAGQDDIVLQEGHVYLVRTIGWPREDVITKMHVDRLEGDRAVTITYQRLVMVPAEQLEKQVEAANAYTIAYEEPLQEGEVTLYSRSTWNAYPYAAFNFTYSTSGNPYITRNSWDLLFDSGYDGSTPEFTAAGTSGDDSWVAASPTPLELVTKASFAATQGQRDLKVKAGLTYLIYHHSPWAQTTSYGAVRVVEIGPQGSWIRLHFRRISLAP